jgi:hypothetical protein
MSNNDAGEIYEGSIFPMIDFRPSECAPPNHNSTNVVSIKVYENERQVQLFSRINQRKRKSTNRIEVEVLP